LTFIVIAIVFGIATGLIVTLKAIARARGAYTVTSVKRGQLKTLRGTFTSDRKGNVTLTLRAGKLRKRPLALTLTVVRGWTRYALLVPTIWLAACVWENRLVEEAPTTRPLLLGAILIVLMAARPEGLFGTPRVEVV